MSKSSIEESPYHYPSLFYVHQQSNAPIFNIVASLTVFVACVLLFCSLRKRARTNRTANVWCAVLLLNGKLVLVVLMMWMIRWQWWFLWETGTEKLKIMRHHGITEKDFSWGSHITPFWIYHWRDEKDWSLCVNNWKMNKNTTNHKIGHYMSKFSNNWQKYDWQIIFSQCSFCFILYKVCR